LAGLDDDDERRRRWSSPLFLFLCIAGLANLQNLISYFIGHFLTGRESVAFNYITFAPTIKRQQKASLICQPCVINQAA
jgi:hypothetical protein